MIRYDTVRNNTRIRYHMNVLKASFYLLMVGKKNGFEVVVVDRGVVVRGIDDVVEVVDDVPVVVRVVVRSGILGAL
jgi:hypothetical protein